ncbi:MAG: hypothetical protein JO058_23935 [Alphaproteobacteria bacterium]|nr:hypothetical protein [Alphaproteobacteria bacterium]MBV9151868.1 hypothetical protein [Alphaproteobacteria bacterium]
MTPKIPSFAAFRGPADRAFFEPGFGPWQRLSKMARRFWTAAVNLPDRGCDATPDDVPAEFFRFPPF